MHDDPAGTVEPNVAMRRYWNENAGPNWVGREHEFETLLRPFGDALINVLPVEQGDAVLEIGCGYGTTLRAVAELVGPSGRAVGIDISAPMVEASAARTADLAQARVHLADAQVDDLATLAGGPVDAVVSRFGVMFFDDPVTAFANIRRSTRPGADLVFVCWQTPERNPWIDEPTRLLTSFLPEPPATPSPTAPGPFAFRDPAYVRTVLERAGWGAVDIEGVDAVLTIGAEEGIEGAVKHALASQTGQLALAQLGPDELDRAIAALRELFARYAVSGEAGSDEPPSVSPGLVRSPGAVWLVAARSR